MTETRKLRVFLCHSSQDRPVVRELYQRLNAEGWIDPWLDEEKILPGQDWDLEIEKAVDAADAVIVCISSNSVTKEGYVQKEIKRVLDISDQKPDGTIFIIPFRFDNCQIPHRLKKWQYEDYFPETKRGNALLRLFASLKVRFNSLNLTNAEFVFSKEIKKETNRLRFYSRSIHLEYKINADAQVINNYLLQRYTSISTFVKFDNITLEVDEVESFDPVVHDVFQYGFIARGHSSTAIHGYFTVGETKVTADPKLEYIPELFVVTICQGQKDVSILNFDTDVKHAHMFTTGLIRELGMAFSVKLINPSQYASVRKEDA